MADTADRRSEGPRSMDPSAVILRAQYQENQAKGLCVLCKTAEVLGRSYCYGCSTDQGVRTYRSGLRFFLDVAGVDWKDEDCEFTEEHVSALLALANGSVKVKHG